MAALAGLIIPRTDTPGAAEAGVHGHLDRLLAEGPAAQRVSFLQGLAWLDGYCLRTHEQPFRKMPAAVQIATLTALSGKADPGLGPGQAFFAEVKAWTSKIYYATEVGQKELNKGGRVPSTYACG